MRLARATALVEYYAERNKVARTSHGRTWKKKHKGNFSIIVGESTGQLVESGPAASLARYP
jgi:hypothetical protein